MFTDNTNETIYIFNPEGIKAENYKKTYPELATIPEFDDIRSIDLQFIWYIANPTSYLYWNYPDDMRGRVRAALKETYINNPPKEYVNDWLELKFSPKINQAIERMRKFRPDVRQEARDMVDNVFKDFQKVLNMNMSDFKNGKGELDPSAYVSSRKAILKELPEIIKIREMGFGVTTTGDKRKEDAVGQKIIENYHNRKRGQ